MRICVVSGTFHPEAGGPPTFLFQLLPELVLRGHQVHVVAFGQPAAQPTYPYAVQRVSRALPIPLRLLVFTAAVWRAGRSADVFFVSDYGLPVALVNAMLRRPVLLKNVGDFAWEFCTRHKWIAAGQTIDEFQLAAHPWRVRFLRALQRWYVGAATRVVAPSKYSARLVAGWGVAAHKLSVIYNALHPAPAPMARAAARAALGATGPLVLAVARLTPWKGIDTILRAMVGLQQAVAGVELVVVGAGPEQAALQAQAQALGVPARFAGAQPAAAVQMYMRAADVFVLCSTYEGLPHTVLEAMQAGTPVVVSDAGGNPEVVTDGSTGRIVPAGDWQTLATVLAQLLNDAPAAQALAAAATRSLTRFAWPALVDAYEAALLALLPGKTAAQ